MARAEIRQYTNRPDLWFISIIDPLPNPDGSMDGCPGTLYEDWPTMLEAITVARWWGYNELCLSS